MNAFRYPIVLFDAGDTLMGPRESFGSVYARVLATLGVELPPDALERALREHWSAVNRALPPGRDRYGQYPGGEDEYWLRFLEGTLAKTPGAPPHRALAARALEPIRDAFRDPAAWHVYDDVSPALASLRSAGVRLAVVSNWDSRLPGLLEALGLAPWFDAVVVSSAEGIEKPHPELFLRAVSRLRGTADQALHVGDVPELDAAGAAAAGIACVLVDRHGRYPGERRAVSDLSPVPDLARQGLD